MERVKVDAKVTLPPGLQAVREWLERDNAAIREEPRAYSMPDGKIAHNDRWLALLDLIETLAGALELITQPGESNCDCVNCRRLARAALDKYREFK